MMQIKTSVPILLNDPMALESGHENAKLARNATQNGVYVLRIPTKPQFLFKDGICFFLHMKLIHI